MTKPLLLHPDRLFPTHDRTRDIARRLYAVVKNIPIISPHGHTDPEWFASDEPFANPSDLLIKPDHYVFRMLYSQGVALEALGIAPSDGDLTGVETDPREVWRLFAAHYHLFQGTPSRMWLDHVFHEIFEFEVRLTPDTADHYYDVIDARLKTQEFRPRALFDRFGIEVLATTESALDPLSHHKSIKDSGWQGKVITTFRPDAVLDPDIEGFAENINRLGDLTGEDCTTYAGYLKALAARRQVFKTYGATASDHGHSTAATANLSPSEAEQLFCNVIRGACSPEQAELFRAHMLVEMARMSLNDGLVMQIHPGSHRNHNTHLFNRFGRDKGADIPTQTNYVEALKPLLDAVGNEPDLTVILFTLDETSYARELAPLAGHYPCLKLGPPWWFHDSPEGMRRFHQMVTETAGFYNTAGFNDDTRAFLSIPARHDVARRMDCSFLADLVADHRLQEDEAADLAHDLAYGLAKQAYRL